MGAPCSSHCSKAARQWFELQVAQSRPFQAGHAGEARLDLVRHLLCCLSFPVTDLLMYGMSEPFKIVQTKLMVILHIIAAHTWWLEHGMKQRLVK